MDNETIGGLGVFANIRGGEWLIRKLAFQRLMGVPKRHFAEDLANKILDKAKTNLWPHNYSLDLSDSGHVDVNSSGAQVMFDDPAGVYLEFGTQSREQMPNLDSITPWALDHGWDPWALGMVIMAKGTEPHPFLQPAIDDSLASVPGLMARFAGEIEAAAAIL